MTTFPPDISFWLFYDGQWNEITPDARLTEDHVITLGRPDEASSADPSSLKLRLNNGRSRVNPDVSGRYSPKNPRSDLFGKIGKNTPILLQVGAPVPELVDTFTRNVSGGWGTTDTGQTWTTTGAAADFSVGGGYGAVSQPATGIAHLTLVPAPSANIDLSVDVATDQLATGASLFGGPLLRAVNNANFYMTRVDFTTSAGIVLTLRKRVANVETQLATFTTTLTHTAETFYRVRFQANGTTLRARIWAATDTEPSVWHVEAIDEDLTAAANVGTRSFSNTGNTNTAPELRFDNVEAITVTEPAPTVVDTFNRTESDGWGAADTGQDWVIYDFAGATPAADYSVTGGTGRMSMPTTSEIRAIRTTGVDLEDVDATFTVATDQRTLTRFGLAAVFGGLFVRVDPVSDTFLGCLVWFAGDSGLPDGQGLRVATSIIAVVDGVQTDIAQGTVVPNLVYAVDEPLRIRIQVEGPEVRMRVWADGEQEPAVWHSQAHTDLVTQSGEIACFAQINASHTDVPVTVHFGDLSVREPTGLDDTIRDAGEISEWPARWDISDTDVWVPVDAQGILRRLNQGDYPIRSLLRRYIPSLFPVAYWSFEETGTTGARRAVTAVAGGQSLRIGGFKFGEDGDVPGSDPLPMVLESTGAGTAQFGDAPFMRGATVPAVDTEAWSVMMLLRMPTDDFPEGTEEQQLLRFFTTGTASEWIVSASTVSDNPRLRLRVFDSDGVQLGTEIASRDGALSVGEPTMLDDWRVFFVSVFQDGANVDWEFGWRTLDGSAGHDNGNTFAGAAGHFRRISTTFGQDLAGMRFGHLSAWGNAGGSGAYSNALTGLHATLGFEGESARERTRRLLVEEGIPSLITGAAQTPMGSQSSGDFAELLREPAEADLALLGEQREAVAVAMRARETLYNQEPVLVLDYANGEIFPPIDPTDDDQRTRNAVTVTRKGGSFAEAIQETGQLNTQNPEQDPDGVGRYPSTPTINVADDDQLPDQAGWRLHLGTVDELRYPRITLKLGNERMRDLIEDVMRVREGDLIRIINPPDWLPADDIDLIVEGYEERLNAFLWEVTLTCSPASPWTIAHVTQTGTLLSDDFEDADRSIAITDGGDEPWVRTNTEARFGDWSFRSGEILDDQTSDAIVEVPDQAVALSFWYKVDSEEGFDFFRVFVGDVEVLTVSGDVDWQHSGDLDVTTASTVTFRYEKDAAVSDGADAAFIDDVVFSMVVSGPDLPDRADTAGSVLVYDVDEDDTDLVVHTRQPVTFFSAEWVGSAQPISSNGDFETDLSGWVGNGAEIERVLTPEGAQFGGAWSLQITPDGVEEFPNAGSDMVPVTEGRTYVLNGWLRCATTRRVSLNLNWFDGAFNFLDVSTNDKTIQADTWTWFEVTAEAPAGAENANLAPTVPDFPPPTDVLFADEVWLRPVEEWSEPQEVPFDLRLSPRGGSSGEVVRVASMEPLVWDVFARTETDGWGASDSGHAWDTAAGGDASDRSVDGESGVVTLQSAPSTIRFQFVVEDLEDVEVLTRVWVDQVATGDSLLSAVLLRASGDYYRARVHFGTSGNMFTSVTRNTTQIGSTVTLPWTYTADDEFWVRVRLIGHRVLMRVWPVDRIEPVTIWHNDQTVTTEGTIDSGAIGLAASAFGGNTNTNPELHFAEYQLVTPQEATVERGINGVQIDHGAGTDTRLARPPIVPL